MFVDLLKGSYKIFWRDLISGDYNSLFAIFSDFQSLLLFLFFFFFNVFIIIIIITLQYCIGFALITTKK